MDRLAATPWPLRAAVLFGGLLFLTLCGGAIVVAVSLAGLERLDGEADLLSEALGLWRHRRHPDVAQWLTLGVLAAAGLCVLLIGLIARKRQPPLHGAARWARSSDIAKAGLRAPDGVVLGRHGGRLLTFGGAEHVLLAAPTRSGKGVGLVIPNLLAWRGSAVVLDVKRENWAASAGFRAACGQSVWLFDPLDPAGESACFNPLAHIARDDPLEVIDELQKLASMLFPAPEAADPFWAEAARTGFIGVGALVADTPVQPFTIGEIYRELTRGDPRERLPDILKARATAGRPVSDACASAIHDLCAASDNTFASIRQTVTSRLGLWLNPRVCAATARSDFDFGELRDYPTTIYLAASPENLPRLAPLYSLLFQQLIDATTRRGLADPARDLPVLVLLDEFARLGPSKILAQAFSYAAGYGLRLMPVLQSLSQLRGLYGPEVAAEIIANCGVEVVFAPKTVAEAEALSQRLGYYGAPSKSRSRPAGFARGHRSLNESLQRRALMLPQELLALPPDELIVLRAGAPPVRGRKIVYWRERVFSQRVRPPPGGTAPKPPKPPPSTSDPSQAALSETLAALAEAEGLPLARAEPTDLRDHAKRYARAAERRQTGRAPDERL